VRNLVLLVAGRRWAAPRRGAFRRVDTALLPDREGDDGGGEAVPGGLGFDRRLDRSRGASRWLLLSSVLRFQSAAIPIVLVKALFFTLGSI